MPPRRVFLMVLLLFLGAAALASLGPDPGSSSLTEPQTTSTATQPPPRPAGQTVQGTLPNKDQNTVTAQVGDLVQLTVEHDSADTVQLGDLDAQPVDAG